MVNILLFTGFHCCQVISRISEPSTVGKSNHSYERIPFLGSACFLLNYWDRFHAMISQGSLYDTNPKTMHVSQANPQSYDTFLSFDPTKCGVISWSFSNPGLVGGLMLSGFQVKGPIYSPFRYLINWPPRRANLIWLEVSIRLKKLL